MDRILVLITFFGWGFWHLNSKLASQRMNPIAMQFIWACCALITAPLYYLYMQHKGIKIDLSNSSGIGYAIGAFLATGIATVSYSVALTMRPVSEIVGFASAYPILVCLLAIPILGETFTWPKFLGVVCVWVGMLIMSRG